MPLYCRRCGVRMPSDSLFCPACGAQQMGTDQTLTNQLEQDPALFGTGSSPAGRMLNRRYRLVQTLGQGGMGAVYAAQDTQLGDRLVAVKEMSMRRLTPQEVPQAVAQFQQEAYLLASLHHPNLPAIHEYFQEDERWYLVMSFIEGRTLQAVLDVAPGKKLAISEVVHIGIELCEVLDYLHTHNPQIIFRDLKPLNIMLTPKGHVCLIDFGIARHFKQDQTKDTAYYLSQGYSPIEQYGHAQTGPRSDIYSLGATLHQMFSGHNPALKPFQFAPLQLVDPTFPMPLAQLIAQMLQMEEKNRPTSVAEVKAQLLNLGQIASTFPISPLQPTAQAPNPYAPLILPTILASASMVQAPSSFLLMAKPEAIEILRTFSEHTQEILSIALSANGQILASCSLDGTIKLWDVQKGNLLHTLSLASSMALSADGRILASGSSNEEISLWNVQTGSHFSTISFDYRRVTSVALSADGRILASGSADGHGSLWNTQTGEPLNSWSYLFLWGDNAVTSLALSADGMLLASGNRDRTIELVDTQTGSNQRYKSHKEAVTSLALSADGRMLASGSLDGTTKLWNARKGRLIRTIKNSTKNVSLNADGLILAIASYDDGTIKLWNTQTGKLLRTLTLRNGSVSSVALSADGRTLASGSSEGTVNIWGVMA
jgi:eukaryotic-like serine/threonine-protein kinase